MEAGGLGARWSSMVLLDGSPPIVPLSSSASPALGGGGRWLRCCLWLPGTWFAGAAAPDGADSVDPTAGGGRGVLSSFSRPRGRCGGGG
jgi:hypothetical protein